MPIIATTRFNKNTLDENKKWKNRNNYEGCIYGTPLKNSPKIYEGELVIILEMNNEENKIEGIGIIKNINYTDKYYQIYKDGNYNRYVYKSKYRIDRSKFSIYEAKIIEIFDVLLFKGSRHLKRGRGITIIPKWLIGTKHIDFLKFFKKMFNKRFDKHFIKE